MAADGPEAATAQRPGAVDDTGGPGSPASAGGPGSAATVSLAEVIPLARVRGEPVLQLPLDLYIPPDALEVFLDAFEGPLDLLLYLIKRQNLDILNIPIADITAQYMQYIALMETLRLELAAEYLLMAAMLAEIKSRMLLPRTEEGLDEEDDPRAELIRRLQEYERVKAVAETLEELPRMERELHQLQVVAPVIERDHPLPDVTLAELLIAMREVGRAGAAARPSRDQSRGPVGARAHVAHPLGAAGGWLLRVLHLLRAGGG